jgi:hypothetical protein
LAVLNFDQVADLHLGSATAELHTAVAKIQSMREMASLLSAIHNPTGTTAFLLLAYRFAAGDRGMVTLTPNSPRQARHFLRPYHASLVVSSS